MTEVIAEIGWNHMGDMALAKKMIDAAHQAGASYAKFQTWSCSRLKRGPWDNDGRTEIYKKAELTAEKHNELIEHCKGTGINFMSSVFSIPDAELLQSLGCKKVKVPSFEVANIELLDYCNQNFEETIVSTGTATMEEIKKATSRFNKSDLILMHCVSSYPCNFEQANLPRINDIKKIFEFTGYSDHCYGVDAAIAALEYKPSYIEKHFTIDNELPGRDNKFAILPSDLKRLTDAIKIHLSVNTYHGSDYQQSENESREIYRGRFNNV